MVLAKATDVVPNANQPIDVYWLMLAENGRREELTWMERKMAYGFEVSGLSHWLADSLHILKGVSPILIILGICIVVTIISEFASNIASIQLAIPVMIALQKDLDVPPLLLMMPATFAASLGFMLPVATAANTIVFGTKEIEIRDMLRVGIVLDALGILVITFMCYLYLTD